MAFELTLVFFVVFVLLNAWATRAAFSEHLLSRGQYIAQVIFVWIVPIIGPLLTLYLKRSQTDTPSGRYGGAPDAGDDFAYSGRSIYQSKNAIETGHASAGLEGDGN